MARLTSCQSAGFSNGFYRSSSPMCPLGYSLLKAWLQLGVVTGAVPGHEVAQAVVPVVMEAFLFRGRLWALAL